jgi:hypothetical protein
MTFKVIGLGGKAGSGKSTVSKYMFGHQGFCVLSFATPLKTIAAQMYPHIDPDSWYDPIAKEKEDTVTGKSPRQILQLLGTEVGRLIYPNTWIDLAAEGIKQVKKHNCDNRYNGVVFDDCRFPNEAEMIHSLGGEIWYIHRSTESVGVEGHASEAATPLDLQVDFMVGNVGTVENLYSVVDAILGS